MYNCICGHQLTICSKYFFNTLSIDARVMHDKHHLFTITRAGERSYIKIIIYRSNKKKKPKRL